MVTDWKRSTILLTNNVMIIVPGNKENKIDSIVLKCVKDLEKNLIFYSLEENMIEELRKYVFDAFSHGCKAISLVQSENCKDIIVITN